jgi:hypothetical protein
MNLARNMAICNFECVSGHNGRCAVYGSLNGFVEKVVIPQSRFCASGGSAYITAGHDQKTINPLNRRRQLVRNITQATSDSRRHITDNKITLSCVKNNYSETTVYHICKP